MNRKYLVRQRDIKDCGVCCLLSIIKYYGGNIPLETLRLDTKTTLEGTTAYNLIYAAKKYGFVAKGLRIKNLNNKTQLPAIAHIITKTGFNHFVVIYKITDKYVYLMDPGKGFKKEKISIFKKEWTNVILIFKPYRKIPIIDMKKSLKELFFNVLTQEKSITKQIIISDVIITALSLITSYYFQVSINSLENNSNNIIYLIIIIFLAINTLKILFEYTRNNLSIHLSKNIDVTIIPRFIEHIFRLPSSTISTRTGGEILTRIQEMNNIKNLFTKLFINLTLDSFLILGASIFLYKINNQLFFILCIIALLYLLVGIVTSNIIYQRINTNIDLETNFNSNLVESIDQIESIKNLDYVSNSINNTTNKYVDFIKGTFSYNKFQNNLLTIKSFINHIGIFIITSIGLIMITEGKIAVVSLITFTYLISYFLDPLENIIDLIPEFNLIKLSFIKASEILNVEEEKEGTKEEFTNGDITFNNIKYSYDDYHNIINNLNLKIKHGEHITLKGNSGCGKSTLCQLLNGSIKEYKGTIKINDINIRDYNLKTLKSNILYVSQREKLFNASIEDNIRLNQKKKLKEIEEVLKIAEVDDILEKKKTRLDTIIYDGGYNLSGGERQRIILARSLIKKPKILILDESLSEVEQEREERIIKKIDKYLKDTTIIYVSHNGKDFFEKTIMMELANE